MKKMTALLGLMTCITFSSTTTFAQALHTSTISSDQLTSIYMLNLEIPITRAEFILAIVQTTEQNMPAIMDTHYALPAMQLADDLGLIDLADYPMETWSMPMPYEEKTLVLSRAMAHETLDMGEIYTQLSQLLVEQLEVDGQPVDLQGALFTHYNGQLMVPLRVLASTLGFKVTWDAQTYSAVLNNGQIESTVQVGFDSYCYTSVQAIGMSAPFSTGAAPRLIDGTLYVPLDYFSMFADIQISNQMVSCLLKN